VIDEGLRRSVVRRVDEDGKVKNAAYMSGVGSRSIAFGAVGAVALFVVAIAVGFETWPQRAAIGVAGATVAIVATTEYRILALTSKGLVLLRSSRIRRRATEVIERLDDSVVIEAVGTNLLVTEYAVGGSRYFVSRRYQQDMNAIIDR